MAFSLLIFFLCFLLWKTCIRHLLWQNTTVSAAVEIMVRHASLTLTDFSNGWEKCYINSFSIRGDEQALEKGAVKAKISKAVEEEFYVSENGTLNLTRKRWEGFQQQRTFHAEDYACNGLEGLGCTCSGSDFVERCPTPCFSTQTSFSLWHHPLFRCGTTKGSKGV